MDTIDSVATKLVQARELLNDALEELREHRPTSSALPIIVEAIEAAAEARALVPHDR